MITMFNVIKGDHAEQHYYRHDDEQRAFIMMTISRLGRAGANSGVGEQARGGKQPPLPPLPHSLPG